MILRLYILFTAFSWFQLAPSFLRIFHRYDVFTQRRLTKIDADINMKEETIPVSNTAAKMFIGINNSGSEIDLDHIECSISDANETKQRTTGYPHTPESRAKISAANKGKTPWNVGKQHSEETKQRIREGVKARALLSLQTKAAALDMTIEEFEASKKKKKIEKIKKVKDKIGLTEEGRRKMSEHAKKRWENPEFRRNYTAIRTGKTHTEETRAVISQKLLEKWKDEEYRSKRENYTMSAEAKKKLSDTIKDLWKDEEFRNRMLSGVRQQRTDNWKQTISAAIKQKWSEDELYRARVRAGRTIRYGNRTIEVKKPRPPRVKLIDIPRKKKKETEFQFLDNLPDGALEQLLFGITESEEFSLQKIMKKRSFKTEFSSLNLNTIAADSAIDMLVGDFDDDFSENDDISMLDELLQINPNVEKLTLVKQNKNLDGMKENDKSHDLIKNNTIL